MTNYGENIHFVKANYSVLLTPILQLLSSTPLGGLEVTVSGKCSQQWLRYCSFTNTSRTVIQLRFHDCQLRWWGQNVTWFFYTLLLQPYLFHQRIIKHPKQTLLPQDQCHELKYSNRGPNAWCCHGNRGPPLMNHLFFHWYPTDV